jgi:hypothetical protein
VILQLGSRAKGQQLTAKESLLRNITLDLGAGSFEDSNEHSLSTKVGEFLE